jgi:hypothetical protein
VREIADEDCVVDIANHVANGSRGYRIWGKKSLGDADWVLIDAATTAGYNFFKVAVEQ